MAAPRPYIRIFWAIFGPILRFRVSFDIKNEFGRSKTFRLHPSKLNFDLPEPVLGPCPFLEEGCPWPGDSGRSRGCPRISSCPAGHSATVPGTAGSGSKQNQHPRRKKSKHMSKQVSKHAIK